MNNFLKIIGALSIIVSGFYAFASLLELQLQLIFASLFGLASGYTIWYVGFLKEENEINKNKISILEKKVSEIQYNIKGKKKSVAQEELERLEELRKEII